MIKFLLGFHSGKTLSKISLTYPTLFSVILELVQNSLDSNAKEISVIIDYVKRTLKVRDDGDGITTDRFAAVIGQICGSMKEDDKLGQFGMGMLSPLGKCKYFCITSIPKGENIGYNRWSFDSYKLLSSKDLPEIPHSAVSKTIYSKKGGTIKNHEVFNYRTEVSIFDFKPDKANSVITTTELQRQINSRFSEAMKKNDTTVNIYIQLTDETKNRLSFKASNFTGKKMDTVVYGDSVTGQTYFEIYVAPKMASGRKGEISVGIKNDLFRIGMKDFVKSISQYVSQDTLMVLNSGTFEGFIISDACVLHPNRKEFMDDDRLMNMVISIEEWVKNHARPILISMKDSQRDEWLQVVGSVAMSKIETRLKNAASPRLLELIRGFKKGFVIAHSKAEEQNYNSKDKASPSKYKKGKGQTGSTPKDHSDAIKMTVAGPRGQRRSVVKGASTGLQFVYEELPGSYNHWEFDSETGILAFNTRSGWWEAVERTNERNVIMYQERVAMAALRMCCMPETSHKAVFDFLQDWIEEEVSFILEPSVARGRKSNSKFGQKV